MGSNAADLRLYAAFTLPDFLNYLVAGASLSVTFIPVFTKYVAEDREDEGWRVFSTVMTFMGMLLVVSRGAGEIFAPQLAQLIAPGFRAARSAPPDLPDAAHAARAILLLPGQHPQRRAVRQGAIRDSLPGPGGLQRDDHSGWRCCWRRASA